jgi:hypothetical protein
MNGSKAKLNQTIEIILVPLDDLLSPPGAGKYQGLKRIGLLRGF